MSAGKAFLDTNVLLRIRDWLRAHQAAFGGATGAVIAIVTFAAGVLDGAFGALASEKLAVAGFAIFYLLTPVVDVALTRRPASTGSAAPLPSSAGWRSRCCSGAGCSTTTRRGSQGCSSSPP
jgi:hypothetical protein